MPSIILIGAGGHGKVVADMIEKIKVEQETVFGNPLGKNLSDRPYYEGEQITLTGFLDDHPDKTQVLGYRIIGAIKDAAEMALRNEHLCFIISLGSNAWRRGLTLKYDQETKGLIKYFTAIHPQAVIARSVEIGTGTVVMARTVINAESVIGRHCIINTGAIVEHDNKLGDYVHISPGATLCGTVTVGQGTQIGAGATVLPGVTIGENCIIGAGAVVTRDIVNDRVVKGIPAK